MFFLARKFLIAGLSHHPDLSHTLSFACFPSESLPLAVRLPYAGNTCPPPSLGIQPWVASLSLALTEELFSCLEGIGIATPPKGCCAHADNALVPGMRLFSGLLQAVLRLFHFRLFWPLRAPLSQAP